MTKRKINKDEKQQREKARECGAVYGSIYMGKTGTLEKSKVQTKPPHVWAGTNWEVSDE